VVRAGGVRADKTRISELSRCDQAGLFGSLDLPVDRGMRRTSSCRDLCEAKFQLRVAEQERKDLALLL
jgi:hypothetical protein